MSYTDLNDLMSKVTYQMENPENKQDYQWDVFISHASEDKLSVASPLSEKLIQKGLRVWLDDHQLTVGDSLRRKIDEGLAKSQFGVVILSEKFFSKEWPQKELDALVSREDGKEKVILPIWHEIDQSIVLRHSPMLADKLAVSTSQGLDKVAIKILNVVNPNRNRISLTQSDIGVLLDQIRWRRHHEGSYSSDDPLLAIKDKISIGIIEEGLNYEELELLLNITIENMKYVSGHNYQMPVADAEKLRQEALSPILEIIQKLKNMMAESKRTFGTPLKI